MNEQYAQKQLTQGYGGQLSLGDYTVGENIDRKIKSLQNQIDSLLSSKKTLGPLLGMKISDIQQAMNL